MFAAHHVNNVVYNNFAYLSSQFRSGFRIVVLVFEEPHSRRCQIGCQPRRPVSTTMALPAAGSGSPRATSSTSKTRRRPPRNSPPSLRPCQSTSFPVAADHRSLAHPRRLATAAQSVAPSICSKRHHVIHTEAPPAR